MNDPLIELDAEWMKFAPRDRPVSEGFARRIAGRFELRLVREIAQSLASAGAEIVSRRRVAPDLLAATGSGTKPLGLEIVQWSRSRKNALNQINQAIATSVTARRAIAGDLTLDLVVVLLPESDDRDWVPDDEVVGRAERLLHRDDGVGYDDIFVGVVGPESHWIPISGQSRETALDFDGVLRRIAQGLARERQTTQPSSPRTPTALLVADEWGSGLGGISTFNRSLAIGLSAHGFDVAMLLPSYEQDELDEASANSIALYRPNRVPGVHGVSALLASASYSDDFAPDVIVGHGRKLGPFAFAVQKNQFPTAKRLHIVHTHAEALEAVKEHTLGEPVMISTEQKRRLEIELAETAELVAGVGPLLTSSIGQQLRGSVDPPEVIEIIPELPYWGGKTLPLTPPPTPEILIVGRTDDLDSKGIEFAVRAMSLANALLIKDGRQSATLVIRGVNPVDEPRIRERLAPLLAHGSLVLRPYSPVGAELRTDYFAATTVLLPSRHEGFGLSAYEAIGAGVPVLVSARSGLGELILRVDASAPEVLPVDDASQELLLTTWAKLIADNVAQPDRAFARAADLHRMISDRYSWAEVAKDLSSRL